MEALPVNWIEKLCYSDLSLASDYTQQHWGTCNLMHL